MANDGYSVAKELRRMNVDVDLAVDNSDFGMGLPEWEDGVFEEDEDPYSFDRNKTNVKWDPPKWIRYFEFKKKLSRFHIFEKIHARINLIKMIREYDVVEAHAPFSIYTQFSGIPYVTYDAGWIREFPYRNDIWYKLGKRGYRKAKSIIFTNEDTISLFKNEKYIDSEKLHFIPFAIDPEKYKPLDSLNLRNFLLKNDENFLLFCPSRHLWLFPNGKGNEKMIKAYAKFLQRYPNSRWVIVEWGPDVQKSKSLIKSLKIDNKVTWIKPVSKNKLIQYYNATDVVIDQTEVGGWGTTTPEAMSCGKPTITSWKGEGEKNRDDVLNCFNEIPPIIHAWSVDEICENLIKVASDEQYKNELGQKSRNWIIKTHHPRIVAEKHLEILKESL